MKEYSVQMKQMPNPGSEGSGKSGLKVVNSYGSSFEDSALDHTRLLTPQTRRRLAAFKRLQAQKFLRDREITGYESAPENDGLEEVRG